MIKFLRKLFGIKLRHKFDARVYSEWQNNESLTRRCLVCNRMVVGQPWRGIENVCSGVWEPVITEFNGIVNHPLCFKEGDILSGTIRVTGNFIFNQGGKVSEHPAN